MPRVWLPQQDVNTAEEKQPNTLGPGWRIHGEERDGSEGGNHLLHVGLPVSQLALKKTQPPLTSSPTQW